MSLLYSRRDGGECDRQNILYWFLIHIYVQNTIIETVDVIYEILHYSFYISMTFRDFCDICDFNFIEIQECVIKLKQIIIL